MKKKITALVMAAAMCLSFAACGSGGNDSAKDTFTVGICQLAQHDALDAATKGFKDALKAELGDKVEFVEQNASNDIPTAAPSATASFPTALTSSSQTRPRRFRLP